MRAIQIIAFVLCFSLAAGALGGMGWYGFAGVTIDPGLEEAQDDTLEGAENPGASEAGSDEFSLMRGALDTLNAIRVMAVQVGSTITNLGGPSELGFAFQAIVSFTVALGLVQIIRGTIWR